MKGHYRHDLLSISVYVGNVDLRYLWWYFNWVSAYEGIALMRHKKKNQQILHNKLAMKLTKQIIEGPMNSGGDFADVMVLLESISVGVFLVGQKLGYDGEDTMQEYIKQVRERVAKPKQETVQ